MPKLKCKADNCAYNYDWLCKKSFIDVDGVESKTKTQTACMSYRNISDTKRDVEFASFDGKPSINTEIYCDAVNCVYETNPNCYADRVEILADNNDLNKRSTHCQTFEPID